MDGAAEARGLGAEILWGLLAAGLCVATAAIPLLGSRGFYFTDDDQTYFLPGFLEIARLLKSGEAPFLSPNLFQGGSFLAEYQYAVLHPVCLLLYLALDAIPRLDDAAALYALVHVGILGGGVFHLARVVGAHRPAATLAALSGATSMWLIYWGASNWIPALVSAAWMAWAAAWLIASYRSFTAAPIACVGVALVILSGWPFADIALVAGGGLGLCAAWAKHRDVRRCARPAGALAIGVALGMPALLPVAAFLQHAARAPIGAHAHDFQAHLTTILAVGWPIFPDVWRIFDGGLATHASPPMHYASWWIPLALLNADWGRLRTRAGAAASVVLAATGLFALLAMAPGVWQLRWPFRMLPYMQVGLAVVAAWAISQPGHAWRRDRTLFAVAIQGVIAAFQSVSLMDVQTAIAVQLLLMTLAICWLQSRDARAWIPAIGIGHIAVFAFVTSLSPHNDMVQQWTPPVERGAYATPALPPGDTSLLLFEPDAFTVDVGRGVPAARFRELRQGTMSLLGGPSVTGYSPIQSSGLASLCFNHIGAICPDGVARLLSAEPLTGRSFLDLARVTRVQAQNGDRAARFARAAGPGWTARPEDESVRFERDDGRGGWPGRVSHVSGDLRIMRVVSGARQESVDLAPSALGGRVVWARNWYPGYEASWNGAPLPVERVLDVFPSVIVPAGDAGTLVLSYRPAGLMIGLVVASLAALAWLGLAVAAWRSADGPDGRPRSGPGREGLGPRPGDDRQIGR